MKLLNKIQQDITDLKANSSNEISTHDTQQLHLWA
jgi:hypothetical protein